LKTTARCAHEALTDSTIPQNTNNHQAGPVRAAIYARTSSPNQRFNYSIDEQIACCKKHAEQRGWIAQYLFIDESERAETADRQKFQLMLQRAQSGCFDVIIFWKLDRFCRSLADLVNTEKVLREHRVALCSVTEYIDTTTSVGRFNFRTLGSVAELEAELIGERARMGLHALAKKHKWPNAHPPIGYERSMDGRLRVNKEETELVRRIFLMYLKEKSMPQVAFTLNNEGVLTKKGRRWTAAAIRDILTDEIYVGIYDVAGVRDYVQEYRILDDGTFLAINETRLRYKTKGNKKPSVSEDRKSEKIEKMFGKYFELLKGIYNDNPN
jgi:site-specific DNA recombinase